MAYLINYTTVDAVVRYFQLGVFLIFETRQDTVLSCLLTH